MLKMSFENYKKETEENAMTKTISVLTCNMNWIRYIYTVVQTDTNEVKLKLNFKMFHVFIAFYAICPILLINRICRWK